MFLRTVFGGLLAAAMVMANGCVMMHPSACDVGMAGGGCGIDGCGGCASCSPVGIGGGRVLGNLNAALTCGSGCGEVYWGEWINHPPDYCDSCDHQGNWTGGGACGASCWHPFQGLRNLWGYRFASAGCESGCSSCATCGSSAMDYESMDYESMEYVPAEPDGGDTLQAPPIPKPAPDRPSVDPEGQQANRRALRPGQVTHATYQQAR
jgi:hypothetical protein